MGLIEGGTDTNSVLAGRVGGQLPEARGKRPARSRKGVRSKQQAVPSAPAQLSLQEKHAGQPVLPRADDYSRERWRDCLLQVVDGEALERDEAIRLAAGWARDNLGLEFKRLRSDGKNAKGLKSAMNSAIKRGELERIGAKKIRRAPNSSGKPPS